MTLSDTWIENDKQRYLDGLPDLVLTGTQTWLCNSSRKLWSSADQTTTLRNSPSRRSQTIHHRTRMHPQMFWLVQTMCWINGIYTYRPMRPRSVDLMRIVRLPVDEMSFDWQDT
ncbi:hypothetical protein BC629DRAFT_1587832 [Irpex lacteus]|nr:hypothetical protein BC629DRAFT_1587832 [Irpex lacteus]